MARSLDVPLPEAEYLARLGHLVYLVSYLEGLVLSDLPALAGNIPDGLTAVQLSEQTTGGIGKLLSAWAKHVPDPAIRAYLDSGGAALSKVAPKRNATLHSRPTSDEHGRSRLYRWRASQEFFIDEEWLDSQIAFVTQKISEVDEKRAAVFGY
ncbi:MAG: hypothetical protein H0T78_10855 [Longispora sp.]|nr:hypothetical protein [Longispora sp. (in: high G+C Gram-positive bacteria)]